MGLALNRKINNDARLGIWKIEESAEELLGMLQLTPMEKSVFAGLKTHERQQQWLAYRIIIKKLLNLDKVLDINYDKNGKPQIFNHSLYISVTHSGTYAAAILHSKLQPGIDIEKISPRIHKVKEKFLSQKELDHIPEKTNTELITAYWCAKEALFKSYPSGITSLKEQIFISPISPGDDSIIHGQIIHNTKTKSFVLSLEKIKDYILVYTIDETNHNAYQ
ncbi:MAG: 4'-phosphopantetheinyl transferase superfamily protein [Bacteroidales bacterium]